MSVTTYAQTGTRAQKLADLRDHVRPLLIFAPDAQDPQLRTQLATLQEHAAEAKDRDLVPVALPYKGPVTTGTHFGSTEAKALRRHLQVRPAEFAVLLIGKDGGEKLRSPAPLSMEELVSTIDAMPMRRDEMHKRPSR